MWDRANATMDKIMQIVLVRNKVRLFLGFIFILLKLHKPHNNTFKYRCIDFIIDVFLITRFKNQISLF
ncbi:hypothetical protein ANACOL_00937 [Anaerotruncus colihominis DSM 17241]|uniref:Uncharacterized protein n=1 Tax=Anaerotruncus colihominis DSM 17241 TaxID=445972 RepID=B0P847_9FIRM|nr:hypothetical protein ANACOL_00937 [Anaerotruncus colihominis DSM 17241]